MKKKTNQKDTPETTSANRSKGVVGSNDGRIHQLQAEMNQSPKLQHLAQLQKDADAFTSQQPTAQLKDKVPKTNMPKRLAQGVESQTGVSMDGVKVHYNSDKPAQLQAKAFAQGKNIHLGKGERKHLPHEAVHVAQQMKGDVKPTGSVNGTAINDSPKLEREADVLGATAKKGAERKGTSQLMKDNSTFESLAQGKLNNDALIQRVADIPAGKDGMCGPSVLAGVVAQLGAPARTVDEITAITVNKTKSAIGEIFTWADMRTVAGALGLRVTRHNFSNEDELLAALKATGGNPVLAGISNVGFPGKEWEGHDEALRKAGMEWMRAHWIAITEFNAETKSIVYKDNGDDKGTVASFANLLQNSELVNADWDWDAWTKQNNYDWDAWAKQNNDEQPKAKKEGKEKLDLAGYLVEFKKGSDKKQKGDEEEKSD